jgi:glycine/sarcosine N-methyltransferase
MKNLRMQHKSSQDRFYSSIAEHYSTIFPFNPAQLSFIESETKVLEKKSFLDAGCGTGEMAYALAQKGISVTAIDLNNSLLNKAREYRDHRNIVYQKQNIMHIARLFGSSRFDGVICFGNTLVHLTNHRQIHDFLCGVKTVLKPGGIFYFQILHYDYIFQEKIDALPTIENETITFERNYKFKPGSRKIRFITRLTIKPSGEIIENDTELLGLGAKDLVQWLQDAGLTAIRLFGDFKKMPFGENHIPLVGICQSSR